jgi:hypothetical protein
MDNFDLKKYLAENKLNTESKPINEGFEDLLQQLAALAEKGEIGTEEIKSIKDTLMSARRQGQSAIRKADPEYAAKKSSAAEKAAATRVANKKRDDEMRARVKARHDAEEQDEKDRRASNKLPLDIGTYWYGDKTKQYLGDLAQYYSSYLSRGYNQDETRLKLKSDAIDKTFNNAQVAWDVYDRKIK